MNPQMQAHEEIVEVLSDVLGMGLSPSASISLADVRKMLELAWVRGYSASEDVHFAVNELPDHWRKLEKEYGEVDRYVGDTYLQCASQLENALQGIKP